MTRINDKIEDIEKYMLELSGIVLATYNEYINKIEKKAACERYFEKIVEAVVDLAFLLIKEKEFKTPEEDEQAFDILLTENIINKELTEKLKDAKRMRNIIIHLYSEIDDLKVYNAVTEELEKDTNEFIDVIRGLR